MKNSLAVPAKIWLPTINHDVFARTALKTIPISFCNYLKWTYGLIVNYKIFSIFRLVSIFLIL